MSSYVPTPWNLTEEELAPNPGLFVEPSTPKKVNGPLTFKIPNRKFKDCRFGEKCNKSTCLFQHPVASNSPSPSPSPSPSHSPFKKYKYGRKCNNEACVFKHPAPLASAADHATSSPSPSPSPMPSQEPLQVVLSSADFVAAGQNAPPHSEKPNRPPRYSPMVVSLAVSTPSTPSPSALTVPSQKIASFQICSKCQTLWTSSGPCPGPECNNSRLVDIDLGAIYDEAFAAQAAIYESDEDKFSFDDYE